MNNKILLVYIRTITIIVNIVIKWHLTSDMNLPC